MRTRIMLDDELVAEGMRRTGAKTLRDLVHRALTELVERHRSIPARDAPMDWEDLVGKIQFYEGYDHKALRQARTFNAPEEED